MDGLVSACSISIANKLKILQTWNEASIFLRWVFNWQRNPMTVMAFHISQLVCLFNNLCRPTSTKIAKPHIAVRRLHSIIALHYCGCPILSYASWYRVTVFSPHPAQSSALHTLTSTFHDHWALTIDISTRMSFAVPRGVKSRSRAT